MCLFTPDTHFVVCMDESDAIPRTTLARGPSPVFADLCQYRATMHFVGQSTISSLKKSHATGQAYCLAHLHTVDGNHRRLMIATLRSKACAPPRTTALAS